MTELTPETLDFIRTHRHDDVRTLALQAARYPEVDMPAAVIQIAGWQTAEKKIPSFAQIADIRYPKHLPMEQCSSETTAKYKAGLVSGNAMADLTGGFGIGFSFISQRFQRSYYIERQAELCELARHNFPLLGLRNVEICNNDGINFAKDMPIVDCIFIDPARRDSHGGKTVFISDCEPDVCALEEMLSMRAKIVMIKLSPMLDIAAALKELHNVCEIHVIAVDNECKELVLLLRKDKTTANEGQNPNIHCVQLTGNGDKKVFTFHPSEEHNAFCSFADHISNFLYEPGASLLKAAPYRLLSERFGIKKLHPNSQLYTSDAEIDFPGRMFSVEEIAGFGKKELKSFLKDVEKANVTVRNFPSTVNELRKKLHLKEGGDLYLFATTLAGGEKVLVKCRKSNPLPS